MGKQSGKKILGGVLTFSVVMLVLVLCVQWYQVRVQAVKAASEKNREKDFAVTVGAITPDLSHTHVAVREKYKKSVPTMSPTPIPTVKPTAKPTPTPTPKPTPKPKTKVSELPAPASSSAETDSIVSYFQGEQSWKSKLTWSGDWGSEVFKKKKFGAFGCGLCALANVYSSLSAYRCSPLDMRAYAQKSTGYSGSGAIEWWNMQTVLAKTGFVSSSGKTPEKYEDFQKLMENSKALIVLVSNQNKKSMWKNTTGHYVTLFLYDKETDQVFLADSGSYERNRHWVPLKKVFQSLKKKSERQYLAVASYNKNADTWRNTEFTGECIFPSNWKTK